MSRKKKMVSYTFDQITIDLVKEMATIQDKNLNEVLEGIVMMTAINWSKNHPGKYFTVGGILDAHLNKKDEYSQIEMKL